MAFAAALAVTLAASELLARGLTRLGTKAGFADGLLGVLAALAADSPELSSAVIAILAGAGSVGVGVVVGSNLFNLAALLGLPAIVAHGIRIRRGPLVLDAAVGLYCSVAAVFVVVGVLPPAAAVLLVAPVGAAYVVVLAVPRTALRRVGPLVGGVPTNVSEVAYEVTHDRPKAGHGSWIPVFLLPLALIVVVAGSFVMVHVAIGAQTRLHLSAAVLGTIVLAALTSLPNLWLALHFARTDRGTALFSSAMNSNSINIAGGLLVPALFVGIGQAAGSRADFIWLILLTMLAVIVPLREGRLTRAGGVAIIAIYVAFVAFRVAGV